MRTKLNKLAAILAVAVFAVFFGSTAVYAWDVDMYQQTVELSDVPDGTAFADILVKDRPKDGYAVDFNEENAQLLELNRDCGLAVYSEDGFTSLLLRHNCAVFEKAELSGGQDGNYALYRLNVETQELFEHFRYIKVVYCSKDGDILGVTNEVKVKRTLSGMPVYNIKASGSSLTCNIGTGPPYYLLVLIPAALILAAAAIIVCIAVKCVRKAQTAGMIRRIQSGETDNERKE